MPAIFCVIPLLTWFGVQIAAFEHRFSESGDLRWRILSAFFAPITHMEYSGLFGFGTGSTYQGSGPLRQMFGLPEGTPIPVWVEGEPERIMLELGPIGFIAWYFMRLRIIVALWQTFTRLTLPLLRELALTAFLVHLILFLGQMVFHITFLVYFWFLAGFIFLLPQLEWLELNRRKEEPEES